MLDEIVLVIAIVFPFLFVRVFIVEKYSMKALRYIKSNFDEYSVEDIRRMLREIEDDRRTLLYAVDLTKWMYRQFYPEEFFSNHAKETP